MREVIVLVSQRDEAVRHDLAIDVVLADIDFMGHVNNATYLTWVQDAVLAHWRRVARPEQAAAHQWVALKHEITYRRPAFLDDSVVATTILEQVRRESAFFRTVIARHGQTLAEVQSRWCCLDAVTRRPTRLAADIISRFLGTAA